MFGFIKDSMLKQKQNALKNKYPSVNIVLHSDIPSPCVNKVVDAARTVELVNAFEPQIKKLSDEQLKGKTLEFKEKINREHELLKDQIVQLEDAIAASALPQEKERLKEQLKTLRNKIFEGILPEAFAVVREASLRTIGLRHFDVQIVGGIVLHEGRIAEMATGEGKTLVATLPAYLNALLGKGVHIVTVNDYLARRDREWMGPIFEFLGLSVGTIQHEMSDEQRKAEYSCDITYGTNNEFGFDYLRDNMKYRLDDLVQRPFYYAIVDEVDSILVDEARTPLIISGPAEESTDKYYTVDKIIPRLKGRIILEKDQIAAKYRGEDIGKGFDYIVDEKAHTAHLTEEGETKACSLLNVDNLHDIETMEWRHHIIQALRAHNLYKKDVDYVVRDGEVIIVDEFTGRMMPGRRWSDGLHQAVEAKENLKIERENQTLATITFQNYFRMYEKLSGMTGTAYTEANEFKNIYQLDVVVMPTNKELARVNYSDCVYKTKEEKFDAVVKEIEELYKAGRPVLVGTISIEKSEYISALLARKGITHQVLNAKYHEMEAQIVAQAGRFKAVTIATNMAGRGTDILLGGNPDFIAKSIAKQSLSADDPAYHDEYVKIYNKYKTQTDQEHNKVVELGGLHVIGTERHEARRIDNQLRGRSGRQGDPGSSRFYVSLEDDLMRLFGSEKIISIMEKLGLEKGQVIEHPWVSKSIEVAQKRVEEHNFEIRKQLLEYDNVMNKQREVIYSQRLQILEGVSLEDEILSNAQEILDGLVNIYLTDSQQAGEYDAATFLNSIKSKFSLELNIDEIEGKADKEALRDYIYERVASLYHEKKASMGQELFAHLQRIVFLQIIDTKWKDHLYAMDSLREGIGLRAYGQRDPLVEYKHEAFSMFAEMSSNIKEETTEAIFKLAPAKEHQPFRGVFSQVRQNLSHPESATFENDQPRANATALSLTENNTAKNTPHVSGDKVGRNDPCPCGSGKKYKKCCGK